jgi:hypothetical protein
MKTYPYGGRFVEMLKRPVIIIQLHEKTIYKEMQLYYGAIP